MSDKHSVLRPWTISVLKKEKTNKQKMTLPVTLQRVSKNHTPPTLRESEKPYLNKNLLMVLTSVSMYSYFVHG